jgi:hypothetical protein
MPYDVFVSYSSLDKPWAAKLGNELTRAGFKVFRDDRLDAGRPWEPQLQDALRESQHLVVIWSKNAKDSPWVSRELATFEAKQQTPTPQAVSGRMVFIRLDDTLSAFDSTQGIRDLIPSYPNGADQVAQADWSRAFEALTSAIQGDGSLPLPLATFTLTLSELQQLGNDEWRDLKRELEVDQAQLSPRYGATREDWQPLGGQLTIRQLLEQLKNAVNGELARAQLGPQQRFRWDPLPEEFWVDFGAARAHAQRFALAPLSVLIIDPIALKRLYVNRCLELFRDLLSNHRTAIFVVPPFGADPKSAQLRTSLANYPYFDPYFLPLNSLKRPLSAQCGLGPGDAAEMTRMLLVTIGHFITEAQPTQQSVYTRGPSR